MLRFNEIADNICAAIDIIVDKKLSSLEKDSTIICKIVGASNKEDGSIMVEYQDLKFAAYPISANDYLNANKEFYVTVLIPNSKNSRKKYILGTVSEKIKDASAVSQSSMEKPVAPTILDILDDLAVGKYQEAREKIQRLKEEQSNVE